MVIEIVQDIKAIRKNSENANRINLLFMAILVIGVVFAVYIKIFHTDNFYSDASNLFEKAEYEKLEELISERKTERPNDPYAYLFLAKTQIIKGKKEEAIESLSYLKVIAPTWQNGTINPLLESIQDSASNKSLKDAP